MSTPAYNIRPNTNQELAISVQELRDIYLFGVDMTDDNGNPFPDIMFEKAILSAQKWLESEVPGLILCNREFEEQRDYYINDYIAYNFIKLNWFPVTEVEEIAVQFPLSTNVLKFDPAWYRCDSISGHTRLVPTQGTFSSILLSQGGSFLPLFYSGLQDVPAIWRIKYKAGFRKGELDQNIFDIIGMKAAMGPLNVAGDLIAGAGIASKSIGLDGLSQSISTTASATNAGYGARILQYNKEIKERLSALKTFYGGIRMSVA
jgi:hypothetical protein